MSTIAAALLRAERTAQKKKQKRFMWWSGGGLFFVFIVYLLFIPYEGDMRFGICHTFLEQDLAFPHTLVLAGVEDMGPAEIRLWYTHINPFGEYRMERIACRFRKEEKAPEGFALEGVLLERGKIEGEAIVRFNESIPAIYAGKPDLRLPAPLPDALIDLEINPDKYRRLLF